jgi:hypothetical protein
MGIYGLQNIRSKKELLEALSRSGAFWQWLADLPMVAEGIDESSQSPAVVV